MNAEESSRPVRDICAGKRCDQASGLSLWLIFILPIIFLSFTGNVWMPFLYQVFVPYLVVVWPLLLVFMGAACLHFFRAGGGQDGRKRNR